MADAFYPRPAPIDAYGGGGFRFAEMSHRGSILVLPTGIRAWSVADPADISVDTLGSAMAALAQPGALLLLGTGERQVFPALEIRRAFIEARIGLEVMDTGAACRTLNVLLAEQRPVGAALIAVA